MNAGPLAGIRILEVGVMLAGPYATMLLADLGAEVIKIEPPDGEISRQLGDAYFASLNRNKQSICIDLRSEAGQKQLGELAAKSHALLVNMKPSAIRRLGLTYDALQEVQREDRLRRPDRLRDGRRRRSGVRLRDPGRDRGRGDDG